MVKMIKAVVASAALICLAVVYAPPSSALSYGQENRIENYNVDISDRPEYELVGMATANYSTNYWHYAAYDGKSGCWMDGGQLEAAIPDESPSFWLHPGNYYTTHESMAIKAKAGLPGKVKQYLEEGEDIIVSVVPKNKNSINIASKAPTYIISENAIQINALPFFIVSAINYNTYVSGLEAFIPIVEDGYGQNCYAMYKDDVSIGSLFSTFSSDGNRIEFTEIADKNGRLNSKKVFTITDKHGVTTTAKASEITIGGQLDQSFANAGAVGMWFDYEFTVNFYKEREIEMPVDLAVTKIVTKSSVETDEKVESKVTVANYSNKSFDGDDSLRLDFEVGDYKEIKKIGIKKNEEKQVTFEWAAPHDEGPIEVKATINPSREVEESDYSNNSRSVNVRVVKIDDKGADDGDDQPPPPLASPPPGPAAAVPDFSIDGFRDMRYTTQSVVKSYVKVGYSGAVARNGVIVAFSDGVSVQRKSVDFTAGGQREIEFDWLTPQAAGSVAITVEVNPDRVIAESDYSNNKRVYNVGVDLPPADLSVTSITPAVYPAGSQAVTVVVVRNTGMRDFADGDMVDVKFTVPSIRFSSTKRVCIEHNSTYPTPFIWDAPTGAGAFQIIAEVNPARSIAETDYSNNTMTINATAVSEANPPFGSGISRREWSERRFVRWDHITVGAPDGTLRIIDRPVYETRSFYAEVSLSARLAPDTMKSGYGVECEVTASLSTNYDKTNEVAPIQNVYAYLPTTGYGEAIKLELAPGASNRWRFPINPASVVGARVQYVPVNWLDGQPFRIGFTGFDAQSPGGAMSATAYAQVMINGNMYEDDHTSPSF